MSNELLPCPFCGGEAKPLKNYRMSGVCVGCEHSIENPHPAIQCLCCGGVMMGSAEHWDRRFVCLDKNGDKVFAGDDFWFESFEVEGITSYKLDEQERGCFAWMPTYGRWGIDIDNAIVWYDGPLSDLHIELVKEDA